MATLHSEFNIQNLFKSNKSGPMRWIISQTMRSRVFIFAVIVFQIAASLAQTLIPGVIGEIFGLLEKSILNLDNLTRLSIQILYFGLAAAGLSLFRNISIEIVGQRLERNGREELYASLLGKSLTFHDRQKIGDLMSRAAADVRQLNFMMNPGFNLVFASIISTIFPLIFIFAIDYRLLLVPVLYLISFLFVLRLYNNKLSPYAMRSRIAVSKINSRLNEVITGMHVVRGASQEEKEEAIFKDNIEYFKDANVKLGEIQAKYYPLLMLGIANALGILHAISLFAVNEIEFAELISFILLLNLLRFPTFINIFAITVLTMGVAAAKRILEIITGESEIEENEGGYTGMIKGNIVFNEVTFGYTNDLPVLKNISFEVKPGETVALVGMTGSGKTSVTKLISRLYEPNEGKISVDGIPLKDWSIESLRSQMALVEQDVFLFSKSIYDNITLGLRDVPITKVQNAAKLAKAHEFIVQLPEGYDTVIGERGSTLSGGQKQRVAIARAIIRNPKILILDDASSAIDSKTEDEINQAIRNVLENRVAFIITHRIAQIRKADHIILLDQGTILSQGDHNYLLTNSEEYKQIFSVFDGGN